MASTTTSTSSGLNVIALVSGGKDSFFSLLHCQAHGHRIVALANLHPARPQEERARPSTAGVRQPPVAGVADIDPAQRHPRQAGEADSEVVDVHEPGEGKWDEDGDEDEADLNSFMYQTVGHTVIPLYAAATGLPLYRQPILGGAAQSARDYAAPSDVAAEDETESMVPLLRRVMASHPEANAVSAGAILSTYQRTRVESVALRLGLTPLAYLWKFPMLPSPAGGDDAQLLVDIAAAGLDARIIKVASGGLDDSFLWESVAAPSTVARVKRAMGRFGTSEKGAVLGEGGEFETLVVDGPRRLFKKQIVVQESDRSVVREGGGTAWIRVRTAKAMDKPSSSQAVAIDDDQVRIPELFDEGFKTVLKDLQAGELPSEVASVPPVSTGAPVQRDTEKLAQWCFISNTAMQSSIEAETASVMGLLQERLRSHSLAPSSIVSTVIILRHMSDFPTINKIYSVPFTEPNPPSRVTISCGELLPPGHNIIVYALVHTALETGDRQGLHVQSRSYWAPANIGPYSQAITVPPASLLESGAPQAEPSSARLVTIAGQIPLIPATMDLPRGHDDFKVQVVLSLQHLWRIGLEMGVQWWSSAVAYFPRGSASDLSIIEKAQIAAKAWAASHPSEPSAGDEEDDMETGPDLWDRKYNPQYMYLGTGESKADSVPQLPDWSVVAKSTTGDSTQATPFFFAAEVEELPRQAGVEWQAHIGLSHLNPSSVHVYNSQRPGLISSSYRWNIQHCILEIADGIIIQTALSVEFVDKFFKAELLPLPNMLRESHDLFIQDICDLMRVESLDSLKDIAPYQLYVPTWAFARDHVDEEIVGKRSPIIPCFTIRNARGRSLGLVALFRNVFTNSI